MHAWIRRALCAVGVTGGIVLLGIGLAEAASADDTGPTTTGESGIISGNQTDAHAAAPVDLSGNQVTVVGQRNHVTSTGSSGTPSGAAGSSGHQTTSGPDGAGSGNQTALDVRAPVNASGNQVTVVGQDNETRATGASSAPAFGGGSAAATTSGQSGIGSGNQTGVAVAAPVNGSGNQVTVIGQDNANESVGDASAGSTVGSTADSTSGGPATTTGQGGLLAGNQTALGVALPVDATGNQVTAVGEDNDLQAAGASAAGAPEPGSAGSTTSGANALLSGNQTGVGVTAPIAATGNQATVVGQDNALSSTGGSPSESTGSTGTGQTTTGAGGIGSGNQTPVGVQAPVDASGNQVTVIGQDNTVTSTSRSSSDGATPGGTVVLSPGSGTVVSPPSGGNPTGVSQGASAPGASALPNTGLPGDVLRLALLGLVLVGLGGLLTRRRGALGATC